MISPLIDKANPLGVTDDVLVMNDILRHQIATQNRALAQIRREQVQHAKELAEAKNQLAALQALLDQYALSIET